MSGYNYLEQSYVGRAAPPGKWIDPAMFPNVPQDCHATIGRIFDLFRPEFHSDLDRLINSAADNPANAFIWQAKDRIFRSIRVYALRIPTNTAFADDDESPPLARWGKRSVLEYCDAAIQKIDEARDSVGEPEHWTWHPTTEANAMSALVDDCFRDGFGLSDSHLSTLTKIAEGLPCTHIWRINRAIGNADTPGAALCAIANELDSLGYRFKAGLARRAAMKLSGPDPNAPKFPGGAAKPVIAASASRPSGAAAGAAPRLSYRRASDVQARPIRWLWPGRIARGKVSMLAGNPGLGKSQVSLSMAAIVSRGGIWPVDRARCEAGNVVILSAEDDAADTIRPRLEAAGADLSRIFILDAVVDAYRADGGEILRAFNLKIDLSRLAEMLDGIGDVALIVIDPVTAYLGETDSHKNAEIRALLSPLSDIAAKHGAAVVCVSHLNKAQGGEALMRVTGSLAFVAAARSAWLVAKDPEDDSRRLFLPLKNNIGNDQSGLAFSLETKQVPSAAGVVDTSCVAWEADAVTVTADQAMAMQGDPEEKTALDDAKGFLVGLLADGPVQAGQIRKDAEGAGFNWRTVQRAADRLGLERTKGGMQSGWTWRLPPKATTNPEGDK